MDGKRYRIVYEDEQLAVIDKPSGMLVIPTPKKETNTLTDLLNRDLKSRGPGPLAHPCHRIDRETSGLVVYAKGKKMQKLLMDQFRKRGIKKRYIAFVHGIPGAGSGMIRRPIYNRNKNRLEDAVTKFKISGTRRNFSVLEVEPVTGRTNQIRIHFKAIGHPLVGESVYAFRKDYKLKFKRLALHALSIEFTHPATGLQMKFEAPMPDDMKNFLNTATTNRR